MKRLLAHFLRALEEIGKESPELYNTTVKEYLACVLYHGFVINDPDCGLPESLALDSPAATMALRQAINDYLKAANAKAKAIGMVDQESRERAVWDYDVVSPEGQCADDFFGAI